MSALRAQGISKSNKGRAFAPNNAVSTLPKFLGDRVTLVDDEVLVEHLKHLASLKIGHGWRLGGECARRAKTQ